MRLRTKLVLGFLTSPFFFFVHSMFSYLGLGEIRQDVLSLQRFIQTTDLMSQSAGEIAALAHPEEIEIGVLRTRPKPGETPVILTILTERVDRARIHLTTLKRLSREPQSKKAINRALKGLEEYRSSAIGFAEAMRKNRQEGARGPERQRAVERFERLAPMVSDFTHSLGEESRRAVRAIGFQLRSEALSVARNTLILVFLLTIVAAFALASLSARGILRLHKAARSIEGGDLDVRLPVRSNDEIGELTRAFNDMTRRLKEMYTALEDKVRERTETLRLREKELYQTQKLAALGHLSAGVAHELGGPLTIIATAAEGLLDRARDERFQEHEDFQDFPDYLKMIEAEAYRLKKVIRRLLNFAKPKSPEMKPLNFKTVMSNVVELTRLDPRAKLVQIHFNDEVDLPIEGDEDRLQEAAMNLVFNALDAVDKKTGVIDVSLEKVEDQAVVKVRDNGMGITAQQMSQLFEPFFTTKPEGAGTGLGLTLVVSTVEAHGGQMDVDSEGAGLGACFSMKLPLRHENEGVKSPHQDVILD
ncbi:MAG: ATP-binding protein [Planctomycetota bacterium]|nr:ATP-binding protein [Planctomycetota bacterium]